MIELGTIADRGVMESRWTISALRLEGSLRLYIADYATPEHAREKATAHGRRLMIG